ncbi:hypothetical protein EZV62_011173 [Acer yangbiense]|uniref:PHD-type domain-containing protein n=1 Tax=Acer yangbiense TaxID=1000413 RepID=A0A5C7I5Q4_9ROSI|nr:hypothetical protein EZV62_011173 [Acer yangbiense]
MSKAEHISVSPSVSSQTGDSSFPKQSTSEQTCELGAKCMHSEPSEVKHLLGSAAVENEPRETSSAPNSCVINEKQQLISGEALDIAFNNCLGQPAEKVSKGIETNEISCPLQTISEQKHEFSTERIHSEQSDQVDHIILNEHGEANTVMCAFVDDDKLGPVSEDMCNYSLRDTEQTLDFGSGHECNELDAECTHSEPSEQKDQLGSGIIQNEPAEVDDMIPTNGVKGNLQPYSEDLTEICPSEPLEPHPVDGIKSTEIGENSCLQHTISVQTPEFTVRIRNCELTNGAEGNLQPYSEDLTEICPSEPLESPPEEGIKSMQTGETSCTQHLMSELTPEFTVRISSCEPLEVNHKVGSELLQDKPMETSTAASCCISTEQLGPSPDLVNKSSPIEHIKPPPEVSTMIPSAEHSAPPSDDMARNFLEESETQTKYAETNFKHMGHKGKKTSKSLNKTHLSIGSDRVLRSRSQEKPKAPESNNNLADVSSHGEKTRKKKNNKRRGKTVADDYSRIKTQLRYLLNRINYEKSLIAAYSGEGWKGLNLEKLKPEKELQRATSEILRRKLKIRDVFRHLDSLCAEGTFPTSLFDSEGQIDSEDVGILVITNIFCAKCGSKDLPLNNDIILCDGACDRGFHQYCLEPPLLKEDIPPDDEGWLCPGCDCKVDCIDMVNDSEGTNLFITDNWKKVFPEAAAAAGDNQDPNFGLPSDDSDDNDYNPNGSATDEKDQGDESSSDESDYVSASDELKAPANDNVYLGLPSDDSEDDDYNPDAPEPEEKVTQDSSSSDFTSDSEDLAAVLKDDKSLGNEEDTSASRPRDTDELKASANDNVYLGLPSDDSDDDDYNPDAPEPDEKVTQDSSSSDFTSDSDDLAAVLEDDKSPGSKEGTTSASHLRDGQRFNENVSLNNEQLNILESGKDGVTSVYEKRSIEKMDYKKLYDETYGNLSSDSSDDEDWTDNVPSRIGEGSPVSANGKASVVRNQKTRKDINQNRKKTEGPRKRKTCQNLNPDDTNILPAKSHEDCSTPGSSDKRSRPSYKRLGDHVTQRLYNSFQQDKFPDRTTKESLAKELELTFRQVSKWFENARWSFNHSSSMPMDTRMGKSDPEKGTSVPRSNKQLPQPGPETVTRVSTCNGTENVESSEARADVRDSEMATEESNREESTMSTTRTRKRKSELGNQASDSKSGIKATKILPAAADSSKPQETPTSGRVLRSRRKSDV